MSAQLKCTICGQMFPSIYWFKSDGICIDCFKTLSDERKRELEAKPAVVKTVENRKPFPSIGESMLIFFSILVVGMLYAVLLPWKGTPAGIAVTYTLTFATILAACIAVKRSRKAVLDSQTIRGGHLLVPIVLLGAVLVILSQIAVSLSWGAIFAILHLSPSVDSVRHMLFSSSIGIFIGIGVAPILEETIFRGIILDGFLKHMGKAKAIVLTALLFALLHEGYTIPYAMALGAILGWIYSLTKSLDTVILLHAFHNLISGLANIVFPTNLFSRFYTGSLPSIVLWTMLALVIVAMIAWVVIRAIARQPIPQAHAEIPVAVSEGIGA